MSRQPETMLCCLICEALIPSASTLLWLPFVPFSHEAAHLKVLYAKNIFHLSQKTFSLSYAAPSQGACSLIHCFPNITSNQSPSRTGLSGWGRP